ncbi:MAG TPA: hypothetical protein VK960_09720 [Acidimicrobiia bacterium]|nr:hypothetical protein [Acidimicrobiia bacterium]
MVGVLIASLSLGGLGLAPDEEPLPPSGIEAPADPTSDSPTPGDPVDTPIDPAVIALGILAAALLVRREPGAALGLRPPGDALVVFVPGHGQGPADEVFDDLIELMGLEPGDIRFFDYRLANGLPDPRWASQDLPIEMAASSLNSYLGAVAQEGRPMYLVGFSKGGATIAHLIAGWDGGAYGPNDAVVGAALLDPPMASKAHGWIQSVGRFWGSIPDDGGYDPVECSFLWFGCRDARDNLGEAAGVDVIVVRNPKSGVTSFSDHPEGLRVYDAADEGPDFWDQALRNPVALPERIAEAHESVLDDPVVAVCLVSELWDPGSCDLPRHEPFRYPVWRKAVESRADGGIWPK